MSVEKRVLVYAIIAAVLFWPLDIFIDAAFHYDGQLRDIVLNKREVSFRSLVSVCFIVFGRMISQLVVKPLRSGMRLKKNEEIYRSLIESTGDSIYLVDRDYKYIYMNRVHRERMGIIGDDYVGKAYGDFHLPEESATFVQNVNRVFTTNLPLRIEHRSQRDRRYFLRTFSAVKDNDGRVVAVTIISKDITDLKVMEERLHSLSVTDDLTGIFNRRGFFSLVQQQMKMAVRDKRKMFILYADVDNLKGINDEFGHIRGDQALLDTATILKESHRDFDIIARIGGDEFVVVPIETEGDKMDGVINRLQERLDRFNAEEKSDYRLSISVGLACFDPLSPTSIDDLLNEADKQMYERKRQRPR